MKSRPRPIAIALVASLLAIAVPAAAQPAADADWVTGYHHAGVQGTVSAMLSRPGEVFVGGSILAVGDVPVRNVARLVTNDGVVTGWSALGDGFDGSVKALAEHDGQVVAAGFFRHSGATKLERVARWDGAAWQPLGEGLPGAGVGCMASFGGDLYAGAWRWDGNAWSNALQTDGPVRTLTVRDGLLYVGGDFTTARGDSVAHVFAWDGAQVVPLGEGLPDAVTDAVAPSDGVVFATESGNVERWDGQAWTNVARNAVVHSLAAHGSGLVVSRWFRVSGSYWLPATSAFDAGAWSNIGGFISEAMVEHEGRLLAQVADGTTGGIVSPGLVAWDGAQLQAPFAPNAGFDTGFGALLPIGGGIVVGGDYRIARGEAFDGIGIASSSAWTPLGGVSDLAMGPGGSFTDLATANGVFYGICEYWEVDITVSVLGRLDWAGDHWQWQLVDRALWNGRLEAIDQDLFVIDGDQVTRWFPYNGVHTPLPGLDLDGYIYGSCVHMGDLVISGEFATNAGAPCGQVLRHAGGAWQDLGAPPGSAVVDQVASLEGDGLVASYRTAWGAWSRVAVFDGSRWTDLGSDFDGAISRMVLHRGRLFVGGTFERAGDSPASGIAMWSGSRWMPVGSGVAGGTWPRVRDLASTPEGLWVCGDFTMAGGRPCVGLGRWTGDPDQLAEVSATPPVMPTAARLLQPAQPNPFNPRTALTLVMPAAGGASLRIFDARGALVRHLLDGELGAGEHRLEWDGCDDGGRALPSGVYVARLRAGGAAESVKLMLVR
ncbi:MAG: hypothetical protein IPJ24_13330 [bacterium]|nr:hypothetical protein [bacterium]